MFFCFFLHYFCFHFIFRGVVASFVPLNSCCSRFSLKVLLFSAIDICCTVFAASFSPPAYVHWLSYISNTQSPRHLVAGFCFCFLFFLSLLCEEESEAAGEDAAPRPWLRSGVICFFWLSFLMMTMMILLIMLLLDCCRCCCFCWSSNCCSCSSYYDCCFCMFLFFWYIILVACSCGSGCIFVLVVLVALVLVFVVLAAIALVLDIVGVLLVGG